jgi:signal transduction histidine kinase
MVQRLAPLPVVAVSLDLPGIPTITADDFNGMRQAVEHLVNEHHCTRIAFIQGPPGQLEAETRYRAYLSALQDHHIPFDPALVVSGDFNVQSGRAAVHTLLDERGVDFQALVTANDRMAFGAFEALEAHQRQVPADVALVGFDDVLESRVLGVPLTTVRQPFYASGAQAVETLVGLLAGHQPPPCLTLPTELVLRWSCGCLPPALHQVACEETELLNQPDQPGSLADQLSALQARKPLILTSMQKIFYEAMPATSPEDRIEFVDALHTFWNIFFSNITGKSDQSFPKYFAQALASAFSLNLPGQDANLWHSLLSEFRRQVLPALFERSLILRAENLLEQARLLIGELAHRTQAYQRLAVEQQEQKLQSLGQGLASRVSLRHVCETLVEHLPGLEIEHCHLALFEQAGVASGPLDISSLQARLVFSYSPGSLECNPHGPVFPAVRLLPETYLASSRRYTAILMELNFSKSQMGYLWTEVGSREWEIYVRLANLLSSALFRVLLIKEREDAMQEVGKLLVSAEQHSIELATAKESADQAAQNMRLALQETESLFEAARFIFGAAGAAEICTNLSQYIHKLIDPEQVSIYLLDVERQEIALSLVNEQLNPPSALDFAALDHGPAHIVLHTGLPVLSIDADDGTETPQSAERRRQAGIGPLLVAPFLAKDQVLGLVMAHNSLGQQLFTQHDMDLLLSLATQATAALENARLYDKITRFNEQLEEKVRQRTEELNQAYQALEKLDQNKTDFINVAAHELRTPLTVIKGYMGMLAVDPSVLSNTHQKNVVDGVLKGTERLHIIINSMLDVARIDSQLLDMHREITSLQVTLRRVQADFTEAAAERHLTIQLENLADLPYVKADPLMLVKVYQNLVGNAIKYTPDGGRITISGQALSDPLLGKCVETWVTDTGIGIDPEHHELIFEKFYQTGTVALHSSGETKFKGGGTGLGLAIVRGIVQAHGGRIWVESPGHDEKTCPGSTFHILLPVE